MSDIEKFETIFKEISTLKAPGVSGSRIKQLTDIAVRNVSQESTLIPILYSTCKSVPSSHKLGSMYVVDSIVRAYVDEAKRHEEVIDSNAPEGSFAAGVYKISELIESLMDDALELSIVKPQTIKILKLVDIWERAQTFDSQIIQNIRSNHIKSTTPPGSPPPKDTSLNSNDSAAPSSAAKSEDSGSILLALASLAQKSNSNSSTPSSQPAVPTNTNNGNNDANNILSQLSAIAGSGASVQSNAAPTQNQSPPVNNEQQIFNMLQQMQNGSNGAPQMGQQPRGNPRMDNNGYSRRQRSRSPPRNQPRRRDRSPVRSSSFNPPASLPQIPTRNTPPQQFQQFQQQPPYQQPPYQQQQQQQQQPQQQQQQFPPQGQNQNQLNMEMSGELNVPENPHYRPRNVGFDSTLPQGSFKVLSRTLFLGGVPRYMDEHEMANVLRPYAEVQSIILNSERKHAFVKVYSRREAEQVITSFNKDNSLPLRTRWGVGFGPRDCCNYQHGVSIIPMERLTEADKSWVVKAQWGGTGGQPLLSGMVIDEPDIEIGSGISSKAMSRKMPTNSARNGPKSNRPGESDEFRTVMNQNSMSHGAQPDFTTMNQSATNPLQGLFNNGAPNNGPPNGGNFPGQGFQSPNMPNQMPNQMPNPMGGMPPGFMPNMDGNNPNLGAQLANFFNQQQR